MLLNYRGVVYEYTPPAVTKASEGVARKYSGLNWLTQALSRFAKRQSEQEVKYRNAADRIEETAIHSIEEKARLSALRHELAVKNRQLSMHKRFATEVGLAA